METYDPIAAEVLQNRLRNISLEMATTLIHTSGSPIRARAFFSRSGSWLCWAIWTRRSTTSRRRR